MKPPMTDIRAQLHHNPAIAALSLRQVPLTSRTHAVVHYNGPRVDEQDPVQQLINDSLFHIQKDWSRDGSGVHGWGLMYHYAIDQNGKIYFCNDERDVLWHCSNGNYQAIGVHCVIGEGQSPTTLMLRSLDALLDWLCYERPDLPSLTKSHVWGHGECGGVYGGGPAWGNDTECPGSPLLAHTRQYRASPAPVHAPVVVPPVPPTPAPQLPADAFVFEDGFMVGGAIRVFREAHGGVPIFGLPISNEYPALLEDGQVYTVQRFERAWLQWDPRHPNAEVQIVRLGALYAQLLDDLQKAVS